MSTRLFFNALQDVQSEHIILSRQLGFSDREEFRHVDWPAMQAALPQVAALVFLLSASSFVIVLTLGGVSATTLEVAIYQSLRLDFDPARAISLSLLQVMICGVLAVVGHKLFAQVSVAANSKTNERNQPLLVFDVLSIVTLLLVTLPILAALIFSGVGNLHFSLIVFQALGTSLTLGIASAVLAMVLAWLLASYATWQGQMISLVGLIIPPAVLALGWFLLLQNFAQSNVTIFAFIVALNTLAALPFSYASLRAGFERKILPLEKLTAQLGLSPKSHFLIVEWPLLWQQARQGFLMAMVLSLGDLTAITLLGRGSLITLPSLLQSEMGHYRSADGQGTALLLLVICGLLSGLAQWGRGRDA